MKQAAALVFIAILLASPGIADSTRNVSEGGSHLYPGADWDGEHLVVFTATGGIPDGMEIRAYDPRNGTYEILQKRALSGDLRAMGVAYTPQGFFLFGGAISQYVDTVYHYDLDSNTLELLDVKLPSARVGPAAAYDGEYVWLFGGRDRSFQLLDEILRFDPETHELVKIATTLPAPAEHASAVWVDTLGKIFIFAKGGISIFDPTDQTLVRRQPDVPLEYSHDAVWTGDRFYVLGARVCEPRPFPFPGEKCEWDRVLRYDPGMDTLEAMTARPSGGCDQCIPALEALWWEREVHYVASGLENRGVKAYILEPGAPVDLQMKGSSNQPILSWNPPPSNSYGMTLDSYTLFTRSSDEDPWVEVAQVDTSNDEYVMPPCPLLQTCEYGVLATNGQGSGPIASISIIGGTLLSPPSTPN